MGRHARPQERRPIIRVVLALPVFLAIGYASASVAAGGPLFLESASADVSGTTAKAAPTPTPSAAASPSATATAPANVEPPKSAASSQAAAKPKRKIEPGTYIMWVKKENLVLLVKKGSVVRSMPTTDNDKKTPVGDYKVQHMQRHGADTIEGVGYTIPLFVGYGPVPKRTGIGFHEVPTYSNSNKLVQPVNSIGKPGYESHGCERLKPADAKALWKFAKIGMEVRVR